MNHVIRALRAVASTRAACALRIVVLSAALVSVSVTATARNVETTPIVEPDIAFDTFTLDNGLTVIVHEDRKAPIVAVNLWYHVGSKDEPPGRSGFAHLFEHLMFQGSENHAGEFFTPFEEAGATDQNGTTNQDRTNYYENVPTTALDMALWMESDRMGHLVGAIDQAVLDEQRGVVQNEKRQGENEPYGRVWDEVFSQSYPLGHPYHTTTIGSMEDLNAASLDDVKSWFKTYYGPNNATLVLAGDIDLATAKEKVQRYFGDIPPGPPLAKQQQWIAPRVDSRRGTLEDRVAQPRIVIAWNVPRTDTDDSQLLALAAYALGGGKTSRLYERLVYREQVADSVAAFNFAQEIGGLFIIQLDVKAGADRDAVERAAREELARLLREGPTAAEIKRAQVATRAGFTRGIERVGGKADALAECRVFTGDPGCFRRDLARIAAATPASVRDVAQRWLAQGDYTLTVLPFAEGKAGGGTVDRTKGVPAVTSFPDLTFPKLQRAKLRSGIPVVLAERHETPVVLAQLMFDAGYAADHGGKLGVASFTMAMLDEGAGERDSLQLAARAQDLGAQIGAGASADVSTITLSAMREELAPSLDLLADLALRPRFAAPDLERVRKLWIAGIAQEKTQPTSLAVRTLPPLIYGPSHPYGVPLTGSGTEASAAAITREDLIAHHREWLRPDNVTIIIVGDTTMAEIVPLLEARFANWRAPATPRPVKRVDDVPLQTHPRVFLLDRPAAQQTLILAGTLAPSTRAKNNVEINTMNSVLGGMFSSRLNMNLRETKHWAYGAYSFLQGGNLQRPYIFYAPVQTDKTTESLAELQREMREFTSDKPATAAEIAKVKANDVRQLPGQYETAGAVAGAIGGILLYGRPDDYVQTMKARLEGQRDDDIRAAAQEIVKPESLTWVIVGDLSQIEAGVRKLDIGPVQVIDADGKVLR